MSFRTIRIGHSPDPDDAFMFYGLAHGKVKLDNLRIEHVLEDIQSLNMRALMGELEVTAISAHAFPYIAERYWIMKTGASMGEGYGPIIVSKKFRNMEALKGKTIAQPGKLTTANLLLNMYFDDFKSVEMPFDQILDAVVQGKVHAGVLIHEGQITYDQMGLKKIVDFGELWQKETSGLPLPLGLDVVRKDLGEGLARKLSHALRESIHYAYTHQSEAIPYALKYGRGMNRQLAEKFVKMYVNELTIDMGGKGKRGLELLFKKAYEKKLILGLPEIVLM